MTGKEMLKFLTSQGFWILRIKGSHHQMTNGVKQTTVPVHNSDLGKGLENKILKDAGLK